MVHTVADSTVASHSFNVAMIAMAIRKKMFNTNHFSEMEVCYYALIHDVKEAHTGDLPTPTKVRMRECGFDPENFDKNIPDEDEPPPHIKVIVKMADMIDNYCFIYEYGAGTRAREAAAEVEGRLRTAIQDAPSDLQAAAVYVLEYIIERKSGQDEEGRKLAEDRERLS